MVHVCWWSDSIQVYMHSCHYRVKCDTRATREVLVWTIWKSVFLYPQNFRYSKSRWIICFYKLRKMSSVTHVAAISEWKICGQILEFLKILSLNILEYTSGIFGDTKMKPSFLFLDDILYHNHYLKLFSFVLTPYLAGSRTITRRKQYFIKFKTDYLFPRHSDVLAKTL